MNKIVNYIVVLLLVILGKIDVSMAQREDFPNIIYILVDDLGYGDISSFNNRSKIQTPFIDKLASEGMRFTDAHSNSSLCTPSRYGILTGRYAWRSKLQNGVLWSYDKPLIEESRPTVASLLKRNGYHTACIGKWHLGLEWKRDQADEVLLTEPITGGPLEKGFDYFYGISASLDIPPYVYIRNDRVTTKLIDTIAKNEGKGFWRAGPIGDDFKHEEVLDRLADEAESYIRERSSSARPFFLYLSLTSPHTPILPSADFIGKSGLNAYGDFVLMTDAIVGRIMVLLGELNIDKNTLIVFTSDNGFAPAADLEEALRLGHQPSGIYRGTKSDIYEGGHRVPFIMNWPAQIAAGSVSDKMVSHTDFMSTCADIMGVKLQDNEAVDSYSILPLMKPDVGKHYLRDHVILHSGDGVFAIRKGEWKLIFGAGSGGWSYPTAKDLEGVKLPDLQLYNMCIDPSETKNLVDSHPKTVAVLTELLRQYITDGRSTEGTKEKNEADVNVVYKPKG
ncbi:MULTISPECIES: sulfatase family protein [Sphingobacterium]|uniref:sulfatase family protein n=1 Tax=Sphingobacterium TaxID=28453 RepID=UPI001969DC61|nr:MULTISPECIES: arylsulfatase [unclassified Sphingobacterium]